MRTYFRRKKNRAISTTTNCRADTRHGRCDSCLCCWCLKPPYPLRHPTPVNALRQRRSSCLSAFASRPSWPASSAHWRAQQITDVPAPELAVEIAEEQAAPNLATFAAPHLMQEGRLVQRVEPTPQETAQNHTLREETGAVDKLFPKEIFGISTPLAVEETAESGECPFAGRSGEIPGPLQVFLKKYSLSQTAEATMPSLSESRRITRTSWEAGAQSSRHLCSSDHFRFGSDPIATVAAAKETPQERHCSNGLRSRLWTSLFLR